MRKSAAQDTDRPPRGRLRAAWSVLCGEMTTPPQIRADWIEYQIAFDGILDKLNTALARIAKRDQRAAVQLIEALGNEQEKEAAPHGEGPEGRKAEVRRKVAAIQAVRG